MGLSAESIPRRYTYPDLASLPDDNVIRSIIDGQLFVSPPPVTRHQVASSRIHFELMVYANKVGGLALAAPYGVYLAPDNFIGPDLIFIRGDHLGKVSSKHLQGPPDLVVEISSPSTRQLDQGRKRELYERFGVPSYWFVDLEKERVEISVLGENGYPAALIKFAGETLTAVGLEGLTVSVADALGG